jgi:hypothetical protein
MHLGLIVGAAPRYAREDTVQPQAETNKQDAPCESVSKPVTTPWFLGGYASPL